MALAYPQFRTVEPLSPYLPENLRQGLVLYLWMNEGSGNRVYDLSGNGNHGTIYGATWTRLASGKNALHFDGVDDYADCGSSSSLMPSTVSALAWLYPTSYAVQYARVLEKGGYRVGGGYGLEFNPYGSMKQRFVIWIGETAQTIDSSSVIHLYRWTHVAGVFDGSTMKLYVNGVLEASRSNVVMTANTAPLTIGRATSGGYVFPGLISCVLIYSRALSDAEIRTLYELHRGLFSV